MARTRAAGLPSTGGGRRQHRCLLLPQPPRCQNWPQWPKFGAHTHTHTHTQTRSRDTLTPLKLAQTFPPAVAEIRHGPLRVLGDAMGLSFKDKMSPLKITYFVIKNPMGNGGETLWALSSRRSTYPLGVPLMSSQAAPCPLQPLCAPIHTSAPRTPSSSASRTHRRLEQAG